MIKNYILVALRQLSRHKLFSALNIFCLAIGICFCMLIGQYVLQERGVNSGMAGIARQYLIGSQWKVKNTGPEITTVGPLPKALKEQYPGLVENYYRFNPVTNVVSAGDRHFREDIAIGDTTLVSMYGFPLLYGDPHRAFVNNRSAVITEELALKLFGNRDALNKIITISNSTPGATDYKVSAVLKALPYNSISNFLGNNGYSVFIPFEGNQYYPGGTGEDLWTDFFTVGLIELKAGIQPSRLAAPVKQLLSLNAPETVSKNLDVTFSPLNTYQLDKDGGAVRKTLNILSLVSLGILLMAIINFVNIMIGASSYRIKEIGLRKVFGGKRLQLILQYLTESIVLTLAAAVLSLCLYALFRPLFNEMLKTSLPAIYQFDGRQGGLLCLLVLAVGCAAGIYPAFILSGVGVVPSVKGKISLNEKGGWMRKTLLVIQFSVAVVVFIFATTITRQVNYFFDKDLGYNREQLMVITAFPKRWDSAGVQKMLSVRDALRQMPAVQDASLSFEVPDRTPPGGIAMTPSGSKEGRPVTIPAILVDEDYASTFGLKLLAGRFFKKDEAGYTPGEMVISESAVKAFGWKDPIGKQVQLAGGGSATVVGVIQDYNYASLHEAAGPLAMLHVRDGRSYRYLTVKLRGGQLNNNIDRLKNKWKELSPNAPFEYFFMDEKFQSMYESEMHLKQAAIVATGLMGLIVMLGIFGVLTLALVRRTREIAVRKVLGAEVMHIIMLFIRQYAALIGAALLIAWPLAWLVTGRWLQQYAYRITQDAGNYLLAGAIVCVASFLLIGLQCMKVALANPVKSLKTE